MSIWTCNQLRYVLGLLAWCLALSACEEFETTSADAPGTTRVALSSAKVVFDAAYGFCVDPSSIRSQGARGTAVFGNCAAISSAPDQAQPLDEAVIAVTATRISAAEEENLRNTRALEEYLLSSVGRASLSKSGKADGVEILDSIVTRKAVYVRMRESGGQKTLEPDFWRAIFAMPEAAVSISVRGLAGGSLSARQGLALVRDFTANTKSALPNS